MYMYIYIHVHTYAYIYTYVYIYVYLFSDDGAEGVSQEGDAGGMITDDIVDDGSDGEFWNTIGDIETCSRSLNNVVIGMKPTRGFLVGRNPTRWEKLGM